MDNKQLKRIADALEDILKLAKNILKYAEGTTKQDTGPEKRPRLQ